MKNALPKSIQRRSLFWDTNVQKIDTQENGPYIIERILDFGNMKEVKWMVRAYSPEQIRSVLRASRSLHKKSRALWQLVYNP